MHRWLPVLAARRLAGRGPALVGVLMTEHQKHGGWRPGAGRPKLPEGQARTLQSKVMWNPSEMARIDRAVAYLETRRANLIRQAVLEFVDSLEASHKIERTVD